MKLRIVHTSDVHGYLTAKSLSSHGETTPYGLSRVKTLVDQLREESDSPLLVIDTGDTIQGSPLASQYTQDKDPSKIGQCFKELGLDVWVLGNHDFNYGQDYLNRAIDSFGVDCLCANLVMDTDQIDCDLNIKPYTVIELASGLRVGVLGLVTQYIPNWELKDNIKGMEFKGALETAEYYVPILKQVEACDLVIVAYHGGFERDLETGEPVEKLTGENESSAIINSDLDIDVLLTGHQHRAISGQINNIPYTQPSDKASYVGYIEVEFDEDKNVVSKSAQLIETSNYQPNQKIENLLASDVEKTISILDKSAGILERSIKVSNVFEAQLNGHDYINFLNQVQMDAMGTDIAGTCFFSSQAPGLGQEVFLRDLIASYPFDNLIARVRITGRQLREYLEFNASFFTLNEDGDLVVNPKYLSPKRTIYRYDIFSGIDYTYDYSQPEGERLVKLLYKGEEVLDGDEIVFATNAYRAQGGGDVAVLDGTQVEDMSEVGLHQLVFSYMRKHSITKIADLDSVSTIGYRKFIE